MRPSIGDIVEQTDKGDLPCLVEAVYQRDAPCPWKYDLVAIDGNRYMNIPDYMLTRPRANSAWANGHPG